MKKEKKELIRLQNIIENDRLTNNDFNALLTRDLEKLLSDYFDFKCTPNISIEKSVNGYNVGVSFVAVRLKSFLSVKV